MIENALHNRLTSDTALAALIGDRVWESGSLDGVFPYITFEVNDTTEDGLNFKAVSRELDLSISIVARDSATVKQLATLVQARLTTGKWDASTVTIQACAFQGLSTNDSPESADPATQIYERDLSYKVVAYLDSI